MITPYFLNMVIGNAMKSEGAATIPSTYYVALSTTVPTEDGSNFTEPSENGYSRSALPRMSTPSSGSTSNTTDVEFQEATGEWGTIVAFGIFDSQTTGTGNLLMYEAVSPNQVITTGNQARFKPGSLIITVANPTT